ncbi:P-loop containing nucleoside triphosphate hydrolases superfamily protein [Perilla frutescens var. hirtella]|nr:P-loop containing nucleoside triphosphate hydrolases superfamily protein [Perilla frutescens var. hirtella]KAH6805144.1 P-loop containing nucleoside triphosphate hydrolases superfamily protein [Perilla frutescens var. frutescens]
MESKHMLMSALGVGIGVGVGLGLASGTQAVGKWTGGAADSNGLSPLIMEEEMVGLIGNGRDYNVTFDQFPYYLSEQTKVLLTSAAFVHLKKTNFSKHTRNLSPASRAIMLSGTTEMYHQMLAKALAHFFDAKLLLLDVTDYSLKIQSKYGCSSEASIKRCTSETTLSRMSELFGSFALLPPREESRGTIRRQSSGVNLAAYGVEGPSPARLRRNASASANLNNLALATLGNPAPLKRAGGGGWCFDDKLFIQTLYKVLTKVSNMNPIILYLRDAEQLLCRSQKLYVMFQQMLKKLGGPVLILGSRIVDVEDDYSLVDEKTASLFPYNLEIRPPDDESHLVSWKAKLEEDTKKIQYQDNKNHITEVLASNDIACDDLGSVCFADAMVLSNYIEEIVVSAISYHLTNAKEPEYRNGKLVISSSSLSHGLSIFQEGKSCGNDTMKLEAQPELPKATLDGAAAGSVPATKFETVVAPESKNEELPASRAPEIPPDNEFERLIRPEVIPASEIGVTFADIGALDDTKESLQELVMLPLRRPDLFEGGLLKPCRGILLFGPPGTGKTMLAKAIANEAGASFINVSMSTIASKWFGEDEKKVRALFTLAAKVSPTIIFVDEVDSMLGQRNKSGEHEAMRKIKNEFMTHWDGLLTKPGERILVLAATNRPFDLDEAIIRRFERRIMVGLPSVENREKIMRTLLSKDRVEEGLDFAELATMTEGYTGSDLKNLCVTAAYRPVRELIQQERLKIQKRKTEEGPNRTERVINIRPLNMQDLKEAKKQVAPSCASEGTIMGELKQWNDLHGEGGSRKKEQLSYFL